MYTTQEAAERLGIARTTVQKWAKILRFKKLGRDFILSEADMKAMESRGDKRYGKRPSV